MQAIKLRNKRLERKCGILSERIKIFDNHMIITVWSTFVYKNIIIIDKKNIAILKYLNYASIISNYLMYIFCVVCFW